MHQEIIRLCAFLAIAGLCLLLCGCTESQTPSELERDRSDAIPGHAIKITPDTDSFPPVLHSPDFYPPIPLPGDVNTAGAEDSPFISSDGETLLFFFTPDPSIPSERQLLDRVTGIYRSTRVNGTFGPARRILLQDRGKLALDGCPFLQGETLWFCSAREGYAGVNLFTATGREDQWRDWQYAGLAVCRRLAEDV
ncbi:MAG: hypothetical protein QHG99_05155 [Methanomicrobiales archaeon]|nr:hypothetical protein [Methanomicrobiales archaeon]